MPKGYTQLTHSERCQIYALNGSGFSAHAIGAQLGRHHSSISRELARNSGKRGYRIKQAKRLAKQRRQLASSRKRCMTDAMISIIKEKLTTLQWSPVQIAGWLQEHPEFKARISHEWIYQYIWQDKRQGGTLYQHLRHHGKRYQKRKHNNKRRGIIPGRRDISERPAIVEEKIRLGDWEADTIIGKNQRGALLTLVDRASKVTLIAKLPAKKAAHVTEAAVARMEDIAQFVHTITFDNGMEFAGHQDIAKALDAECFFARPYHSWERGLNEHTNGLIRQYFPKKTDLTMITHGQAAKVQWLLNNRPRKCLNFKTPLEVFKQLAAQSIQTPVALHT